MERGWDETGSNVTEVKPGTTPGFEATDAVLTGLQRRWAALTAPGQVPDRVLVTPEVIGDALPHAFVAERIAPGISRLRVAGRKVSDVMGCDARGMPLSYIFGADSRDTAGRLVETCFSRPAIIRMPLVMPQGIGRSTRHGEMLLMPLADVAGQVTRALGAIVMDADVTAPRKCQITPLTGLQITPIEAPKGPQLRLVVDNTR